jgi:hypothetical protein
MFVDARPPGGTVLRPAAAAIGFSRRESAMSRRLCFPCVAFLLACVALSGPVAGPAEDLHAAPAPVLKKQKVEVVFVIDTTGSMGGWLEMCKAKFWSLCYQFTNTRPAPELRVGMVDYKDKGDVWVTKVYDLTDDLDTIYSSLLTFRADGGGDTPEHVNQALYDAVHKVKWSTDPHTLRLIYLIGDAPAHMDYVDDVKYPVTCREAVKRGIAVNAIQCGNDMDCTKHWKDIANLGGGSFIQLLSSNTVRPIPAPGEDRRLSEIHAELLRTVLVWGNTAKRDADQKKLRELNLLRDAGAAERLGCVSRGGRVAFFDLLDSLRGGKVKMEALRTEELPLELQKLSAKDRREFIDKVSRKRSDLFREAAGLDKKRWAHVTGEMSRSADNFDRLMLDILRKHGKKYHLKY